SLSINPTAGQSVVYGISDPISGFTYSQTGLVNGITPSYWNSSGQYVAASTINDILSGNLGRATGENVGTYTYTIGGVAVSAPANYSTSLTAGTFAITPANLSITPTAGQSVVYGISDPATGFAYSDTGLVNGVTPSYWNSSGVYVVAAQINDTLSGNLGRAAGENVGTYAYTIGGLAANTPANYTTTLNSGTFAITPASLSISPIAGQSIIYGSSDPVSGFTYSSTGLINSVTPSYWNSSGVYMAAVQINDTLSGKLGRAAGENVSTYAYTIGSLATNTPANYSTTLNTETFAITPASLSITPNAGQSVVYGISDPASGFTYSQTGLINGVTPSYWNSSGQYVAASSINDILSGKLGRAAGENVGTYAYTIGSLAASTPVNYSTTFNAGTFAITPASLRITPTAGQSIIYGANDPVSGFTYSQTGLVNSVTPSYWNSSGVYVAAAQINDTLSGNLGRAAGENVDTYTYTIGGLAASTPANYGTSLAAGTFAITPANLSLTPTVGQSIVYGTSDPINGFTYSSTGLVNGVTPSYWNSSGVYVDAAQINDMLSGKLGRAAGENAGTYAYTIGSLAASTPANYSTSLTARTFAITPASLSITPTAGQSVVYGISDPASGFTYSQTGLVNGVTPSYWNSSGTYVAASTIDDTLSGKLGRDAGESVGTYAYTIGGFATNGAANYNITLNAGTFTITPASLSITPTAGQSIVYGTSDPIDGFNYSKTGLVTGVTPSYWNSSGQYVTASVIKDTLQGHLGRASGENVGSYAYTIGNLTPNTPSNYIQNFNAGTFAITPAPLVATITNQLKIYGTNDPSISGIVTALQGIVNITVNTWNSSGQYVAAPPINDTGNVTSNLVSLVRASGESVANSPYSITAATFSPLSGSARGNYTGPTYTSGSSQLTIAPASLIINAFNASKLVGEPTPVFLYSESGLIFNGSATNWMNVTTPINGSITGALISLANNTPGTYPIIQGSLTAGSNYQITYNGALFTIEPGTTPTPTTPIINDTGTLAVIILPNSLGQNSALCGAFDKSCITRNSDIKEGITHKLQNELNIEEPITHKPEYELNKVKIQSDVKVSGYPNLLSKTEFNGQITLQSPISFGQNGVLTLQKVDTQRLDSTIPIVDGSTFDGTYLNFLKTSQR
ncbi:MAG: MBG domain-containing protein, partial [Legionella sp.]|nr:MBG domain-containing protein [Legionella sp.]